MGTRWTRCFIAAVVLAAGGCGDDPAAPLPVPSGTVDAQGDAVGVLDTSVDTGSDTGSDIGPPPPDTGDDLGPEIVDGCSHFGCPCAANDDCDSSMCIEGPDGRMCTDTCVDSCPSGAFDCVLSNLFGPDATSICVPRHVRLCRPCIEDSECKASGDSAPALCLPALDANQGSFCTSSCAGGVPCPDGYACSPVSLPNGATSDQCVPISGQCECRDSWAQQGYTTECVLQNQFGACTGTRTCGANGLTSCSGTLPTLEICNGVDDDCNGSTDDVSPDACTNQNSFGSCTGVDACSDGAPICDGPVPAPDTCNGVDDDCDGDTDEGACDDGLACTDDICSGDLACQNPIKDDFCVIAGQCFAAGDANPADPCEQCLPSTSKTAWTDANGLSCNDGNPCTHSDVCSAGTCSGQSYSCNDGLSCTDNLCDGDGGCDEVLAANFCLIDGACYADGAANPAQPCQQCKSAVTPKAWADGTGGTCDDGDICSANDTCVAGVCQGTPYTCDDLNDCTIDTCNGDGTCSYSNVSDTCLIAGVCWAAGTAKPGSPCEACRPDVTLTAWSAVEPGSPCEDGKACTHSDACIGGSCVGTTYDCDDGLSCTADACDGDGECTHDIKAGNCLIDGDCYQDGEANPANPCQVCDATFPKQWSPSGAGVACNDGNPCSYNDSCSFGTCSGTPYQCNDGKPCTTDSCNGDGTCTFAISSGCVINGQCVGAGDAQPGNPCMACQPEISTQAWTPSSGLACNDGDDCTKNDVCQSGVCKGTTYSCADSLSCTTDVCDGDGGCTHPLAAGNCLIDGVCYANGQANGGNPCQYCQSGSPNGWSNKSGSCDDANDCTTGDICTAGVCVGTPNQDSYEPNDIRTQSKYLGAIEDNDGYASGTFSASLYGVGDVDWYRYYDEDVFGGSIYPRAELKNLPAGTNYDLCIFFDCDEGGDDHSCEDGTATVVGGLQGCCSKNGGTSNENVRLNPSCDTSDDSGNVYVRVTRVSGNWTCDSYSLTWGDD